MLAMPYSNENWNDMRRCDYDTNIFMNWDKSYYYRNTQQDLLTARKISRLVVGSKLLMS